MMKSKIIAILAGTSLMSMFCRGNPRIKTPCRERDERTMKRPLLLLLALPLALTAQGTQDTLRQPWTVGVALSGGAALGLAHVGVLKVLEEEGIPISYISGTSMGSIVAGMYAAGYSPSEMDSILTTVDWSALFSDRIPENRKTLARREEGHRNIIEITHRWFVPHIPSGVVSLQNVEILLTDLLAEAAYDANYNFDSLTIPYRCVAVDVVSGEKIVFKEGSMVDAIRASIAIPGVFSPARVGGRDMIDGGAMQNLPVEPLLEFNPDFIIASDVIRWTPEARSIIDVVTRTMAIVTEQNRREQRKLASVVIYPNVDKFLPSDFGKAKELVKAGEATAWTAMPAIKQRLGDHPLVPVRNPRYSRPRPVVNDVRIEGLKITRDRVVRRQIVTSPGDTLDFSDLVGDLERLRETGLFRHVSHDLEFSDSTVDVIFTVQEKDYGLYGLSAYYDNVYGFAVRLEVAQGNLFGTGVRLGVSMVAGEPRDWRIGITGARFFALPFTYRLEAYGNLTRHILYDELFDEDYLTYYLSRTAGAEAELGYSLGRTGYFTIGYAHRDHYHQLPTLVPEDRWEIVTGPTFKLRFSTLDDLSFPNTGFDFTFDSKFGLPNATIPGSFLKLEAQVQRYFQFGEVIVLGTHLGYGLGTDSLPRAELFRLGGTGLLGAREEEFAVEEYASARVVLAYRLFDIFANPRYPFRVELISDIAAFDPFVWSREILDQTFMGAGLGIGTNTPIGPIRAYLGLSSTRRVSFMISIGMPPCERI
jgi:NTE family protein